MDPATPAMLVGWLNGYRRVSCAQFPVWTLYSIAGHARYSRPVEWARDGVRNGQKDVESGIVQERDDSSKLFWWELFCCHPPCTMR